MKWEDTPIEQDEYIGTDLDGNPHYQKRTRYIKTAKAEPGDGILAILGTLFVVLIIYLIIIIQDFYNDVILPFIKWSEKAYNSTIEWFHNASIYIQENQKTIIIWAVVTVTVITAISIAAVKLHKYLQRARRDRHIEEMIQKSIAEEKRQEEERRLKEEKKYKGSAKNGMNV